ncbi:hypothetical protein ACX80E_04825 [Arthrobacter sp. TMN-49]
MVLTRAVEVRSPQELLDAIAPRYDSLAKGGLGSYLAVVLRKAINRTALSECSQQIETLTKVDGAEIAGIGAEVADAFISSATRQSETPEVLRSVSTYLSRQSPNTLDAGLLERDESLFLRALIIATVHAAVDKGVAAGNEELVASMWMSTSLGTPTLQVAIRSEAHGKADVVVSELFRQSLDRLSSRRADFPKRTREKWLMPLLRANGAL